MVRVFNAESGLSQKSVDEGGPVLDALEPVLHDVTAASWLGELQEPRLPRLFFMFAQAGVHCCGARPGRGPVPEGAAPRASCVYHARKGPEYIGPDHLPPVSTFIADWMADSFADLAAVKH